MEVRMNPEQFRIYQNLSPSAKVLLSQLLEAGGYDRPTLQQRAEAVGDAMEDVCWIVVYGMLTTAAFSLCFGVPILTVRMVLENWQAILKIVGGF